jgi:hypothetical protein
MKQTCKEQEQNTSTVGSRIKNGKQKDQMSTETNRNRILDKNGKQKDQDVKINEQELNHKGTVVT